MLFGVALALLAACGGPAPLELPGAASEPAEAVRELATRLQANDLVGFARAALPPDEYARVQAAWQAGQSRWPLTELPLDERLPALLAALAAPDSEKTLQRAFDGQFANQGAGLKNAARSLGLFGVSYLRDQGNYTAAERAHYTQVVAALSEWGAHAPLADRGRAQAAIKRLTASARRTGLYAQADFNAAGLEGSLTRLSPFLADVKDVLGSYDLFVDRSLADLRTGLVRQQGDQATVRIHYPLAGREVDTLVSLTRREGRWYLDDYLRHATEIDADAASAGANGAAAATGKPPFPPATP